MKHKIGTLFTFETAKGFKGIAQVSGKRNGFIQVVVFKESYSDFSSMDSMTLTPIISGYTVDVFFGLKRWTPIGVTKVLTAPKELTIVETPEGVMLNDVDGKTIRLASAFEISLLDYESQFSPIVFSAALDAYNEGETSSSSRYYDLFI